MPVRVLAAAALAFASVLAHADTIISYQGTNFTVASSPYTISEAASGSLTLAGPLAPDQDGTVRVVPSSYLFHVGSESFSSTEPLAIAGAYLNTDSSGNLVDLFLSLIRFVPTSNPNAFYEHELSIAYGPTIPTQVGTVVSIEDGGFGYSFTQGSLAVSSTAAVTPEPASFGLLGTGLFGLVGLLRKRSASAA